MDDKYSLRAPGLTIGGWVEQFRKLVTDAGCEWRNADFILAGDPALANFFDGGKRHLTITKDVFGVSLAWKTGNARGWAHYDNPTDAELVAAWRRFTGDVV